MKKKLSLILALVMIFALAACSSPGTGSGDSPSAPAEPSNSSAPSAPSEQEKAYTIGVLYLDQEVLLSEATAGCRGYAADHPNVTLVEYNADKDVTTQLQQCENLISLNVDAIAITPVDGAGCDQMIQACAEADIPLICFHARVDGAPITNILFDNIGFGTMQVDYAMELFEKNGGSLADGVNVAIVTGKLDNQNAVDRCKGYEEELKKFETATIVDQQVGSWNRDEAMAIAENWITSGQDIDIILSNNDAMAIGISLAYDNAGKERPIIVGVGGTEEGLTAILNGDFDGTIFQPAYQNGYDAMEYTVKYLNGETLDESYVTPGELITPDTAQKTLDELRKILNG